MSEEKQEAQVEKAEQEEIVVPTTSTVSGEKVDIPGFDTFTDEEQLRAMQLCRLTRKELLAWVRADSRIDLAKTTSQSKGALIVAAISVLDENEEVIGL